MTAFLFAVLLVPAIDHAIKRLILARLGSGSLSLGVLGDVRVVRNQIWMARIRRGLSLHVIWSVWVITAAASVALTALVPSFGLGLGLLVGGALSHVLETWARGEISDYVCLRFWPPFNLADVALTAGAVGLLSALFDAA